MESITVRNVNHALPRALALLRDKGKPIAPRSMPTLEIEGPFATTYTHPQEMVLFGPVRDANPFFHFFEALWILAGRDDVKFLAWFLPGMAEFSDDGYKFHAPYGYRLRHGFGDDQIEQAITKLREDPDSRQAVMSIWSPRLDWLRTKDVPCNDMLMFKVRDGALRMTVCNRSNDAVLGAYGANVVQFSTLLVYMAARIGVSVGSYTQVSDSFHVYRDNPYWVKWLETHTAGVEEVSDPYVDRPMRSTYLTKPTYFMNAHSEIFGGQFDEDLTRFFTQWDIQVGTGTYASLEQLDPMAYGTIGGKLMNERWYLTSAFANTVLPMLQTFHNWRIAKDPALAMEVSNQIWADDWRVAVQQWMQRRIDAKGERTNA